MITGFTLFWNPGKKAWQCSTRVASEEGWIIKHIPDEEAQRYFRMLGWGQTLDALTDAINGYADVLER